MKFKCTVKEKRQEKLKTWHKWFAWYPVRINSGECCWLEFVERKGKIVTYGKMLDYSSIVVPEEAWEFKYR